MLNAFRRQSTWKQCIKYNTPGQRSIYKPTHVARQASHFSTSLESEESCYKLISGPPIELGFGKVARLCHSSVVGRQGDTVVLVATARQPGSSALLTVDYRQRYHGVGELPSNRYLKDNAKSQPPELLASRALDRCIRPVLKKQDSVHTHVHAAVQSYRPWSDQSGHPLALAINASAACLMDCLTEPVAASALAVQYDGSCILNPSWHQLQSENCIGELLFCGTRDRVVMLEWAGRPKQPTGLPESLWKDLLYIGQETIQPILETILEYGELKRSVMQEEEQELNIRASLGLPSNDDMNQPETATTSDTIMEDVVRYCQEHLGNSLQRVFGFHSDQPGMRDTALDDAHVHNPETPLLGKVSRGKREQVLLKEIERVASEYLDKQGINKDEGFHQSAIEQVKEKLMRQSFAATSVQYGCRGDGRGQVGSGWKTVRPIQLQVPALPDTVHGSSLFARGETQVLCTVTLGAPGDGQSLVDPYQPHSNPDVIPQGEEMDENDKLPVGSIRFLRSQESLISDLNSAKVRVEKELEKGGYQHMKRLSLQYDFPAYSTGNVPIGSLEHNRRSVGHGALAEKALLPVLPGHFEFPYAVRITSEVTDSNGSSSMATVCGGTAALLDAGVPIFAPVAGVSVGMTVHGVSDGKEEYGLLLDITGTEDHYGAMDFKVAGTTKGVTALQLDVKQPLPIDPLVQSLYLARDGRNKIIDEMASQAMSLGGMKPRPRFKESAPRVELIRFDPQRKRDLVGPGGVVLRQLEERYGVSIDLTVEGQCLLFGSNRKMVEQAKYTVMDLVADVVEGQVYRGTIIEIKDFGAIVEVLRNKEGVLHISEIVDDMSVAQGHPKGVAGYLRHILRVGSTLEVLCIGVDPVQGSIKLSYKALCRRR